MPDVNYYKPRGIPSSQLEEVVLTLDEYEAIKLADYGGLYQEEAAGNMDISRQTFGRIIESAHRKIADAIINGKALKIEGGEVEISSMKKLKCKYCKRVYQYTSSAGSFVECPRCKQVE